MIGAMLVRAKQDFLQQAGVAAGVHRAGSTFDLPDTDLGRQYVRDNPTLVVVVTAQPKKGAGK